MVCAASCAAAAFSRGHDTADVPNVHLRLPSWTELMQPLGPLRLRRGCWLQQFSLLSAACAQKLPRSQRAVLHMVGGQAPG